MLTMLPLVLSCYGGPGQLDPIPGTFTYDYTLTSTNLSPGIKAIFVSADASADCSSFPVPTQDFVSAGASGNAVLINFSKLRSIWFFWSIYLDQDGDGLLTAGDDVWGTNPAQTMGFCVDPQGDVTDTFNKNWESYGTGFFGGNSVFAGPTQSY